MHFQFSIIRKLSVFSILIVLICLSGCGKERINQPVELDPDFKDKVLVERLWKKSVGIGDDGLKLSFVPYVLESIAYNIDTEGFLTATDISNGKRLWSKDLDEAVSSGLNGDRKQLYYTTFQGEMVALSIDGSPLWRANLSSEAISRPTSNGNLVAVQTVDGKLFVFGSDDGKLRWRYDSIGPLLSLRGTPSPIMSLRYTLTSFANGELLAFDNQTGQPYWKAVIAAPQGRTELERLVDPDGQSVIDGDTLYTIAFQGNLVALDLQTGQEKWSKKYSSFNSLGFGFGKLFVTTADGNVLAINPRNGSEIWKSESFKYRRLTSPVVYDRAVVFSDFEGYLHFLNVSDGQYLARKQPDDSGVMGELMVIDKKLIILSHSGDLFAYQMFSPREMLNRALDKKLAR